MNQAKIRLSAKEMEMVSNPDFILTKNSILDKAVLQLESLRKTYSAVLTEQRNQLPEDIKLSSSKITRGENYLGLPYRLLDYPAIFSGENIFAIRTMFWWGNFFSITLHIAGKYKKIYEQRICSGYNSLKSGFQICVNANQWDHHFDANNYTNINNLTELQFNSEIMKKDFVKLATYIPVGEWNYVIKKMPEQFRHLIEIISD